MNTVNESEQVNGNDEERRGNKLRFDKSINLGGILALIILLYTIINGFSNIRTDYNQTHERVEMMWNLFTIEHPDLAAKLK